MKSIILFLIANVVNLTALAQGVSVNATGNAPNPNSILDVSSDDRGVLIPRITTIARVALGGAMGTAENGMLVYDKTLLVFYYWDGTMWVLVGNGTGSDDQNLTGATLNGSNVLQIDIENGNSAIVDLSTLQDGVNDADSDPSNEIQTISKAGSTVTLSSGGGSFTDDDTQLTEGQVDAFANNNGYLTSFTEVDGSLTNEIQDLSLNTTTNVLTITNNGSATNIDLTPYIDNTDSQTLSLTGSTLEISNGNNVTLTDNINDADSDPNNEIELPAGGTNGQVLSTDGSGGYSWKSINVLTVNVTLPMNAGINQSSGSYLNTGLINFGTTYSTPPEIFCSIQGSTHIKRWYVSGIDNVTTTGVNNIQLATPYWDFDSGLPPLTVELKILIIEQ